MQSIVVKTRRISAPLLMSYCIVFASTQVNAQFFDSLSITANVMGTAATRNTQPFWIQSNSFGKISDRPFDLSTGLNIQNKNILLQFEDDESDDKAVSEYKEVIFSYGLHLINNNHFKKTFFEEGFAKVEYQNWAVRFGRFEEIIGEVDHDLSSGSLGVSGNSLPIPKIEAVLSEFKNIPGTGGLLQFKGSFAHGWFGNDRYMKRAYYHQKSFYVRIGRGKLKLYGGLQHYAEWGGERGYFHADRSLKGFWNVVLVKQADDGSVGTATNGIKPSRAGDQRGCLEAGADLETDKVNLHAYGQMPFESGEEISPKNRSFLLGVSVTPKESFIEKLVVEFLYTKDMNAFVGTRQRNSYYNNGEYKTGWEYEDRVIGTPLFLNRIMASPYFTDLQPFDWNAPNKSIPGNDNIVNNKVSAIHIGGMYHATELIQGKTILTYSRNYGSLRPNDFTQGKNQFYTLQQFDISPSKSWWTFKAGIGFDFGQLNTNIGVIVGATYRIL